ncbi:expansin B3 [Striga asiatica]|uniref:Expansin B3 n=1 Tax=Striga asiatica TaxID=4170 RepID=A0A5A7P0I7_STRAF|nr:expansin B3 [Striga asiatica]
MEYYCNNINIIIILVVVMSLVMGGESYWLRGTATWYGDVDGDGSDGGACGYGPLVHVKPYHGRVSAGNAALFQKGFGCGTCFKVKCLDPSLCRRRAVTVIITDECPQGGACSDNLYHFDLSGPAYGRLAMPKMDDHIRALGEVPIVFRRTPCKYPGRNIAFHIDEGSTPYWLSILVEFENGEGDIGSMSIREANSDVWHPMTHLWRYIGFAFSTSRTSFTLPPRFSRAALKRRVMEGLGYIFILVLLAGPAAASNVLAGQKWQKATATWYGSPEGDGSDGGACGYGSLVDVKPFRARVGAVSPVLFKDGEGCGACYKVKCLDSSICTRRAVTVIITDECPGGYCSNGRIHFDLSGAAFGRMAVSGEGGQLRNRGEIPANSNVWLEMTHIWGANWCIIAGPLQGPFSVKLTTLSTGKTVSARDVIPRNWAPKATYTSRLNF